MERRQYLACLGGAVVSAGCSGGNRDQTATETEMQKSWDKPQPRLTDLTVDSFSERAEFSVSVENLESRGTFDLKIITSDYDANVLKESIETVTFDGELEKEVTFTHPFADDSLRNVSVFPASLDDVVLMGYPDDRNCTQLRPPEVNPLFSVDEYVIFNYSVTNRSSYGSWTLVELEFEASNSEIPLGLLRAVFPAYANRSVAGISYNVYQGDLREALVEDQEISGTSTNTRKQCDSGL